MTETRPPAATAVDASPLVAEPTGLAGLLSTGDHKRVGRLFIATSLLFLLVGGVLGAVLNVERVDSGLDVLGDDVFGQVYTLHGMVAVFLFLVPLVVGLATYVVPLQVGARNVAFPRGSATAYWAYLLGGVLLVASYIANGGPGGGSNVGVDLWILSLVMVNVAVLVALVSVLTTIVTMRAPGMTLDRAPLFTWSVLVGGGLTLLATPLLVAELIVLYVAHHYGDALTGDTTAVSWFFSVPQVYLLVVPVAGIIAEIVPVLGRTRQARHGVVMGLVAALGVVGFGGFARDPETFDDLLYVAMGVAVVIPALGLFAGWLDTLRRGSVRLDSALLLAVGAGLMLVLGALCGAAAVIEPFELQGTTWIAGQVHFTLLGAGTMGAAAGLFYWAPKIWGVRLGEATGKLAFASLLLGTLLLGGADLVNGLVEDVALTTTDFEDTGLVTTLNVVSALGGALAVIGALALAAAVAGTLSRRRQPAGADPWDGHTLEWAADSPPSRHNFDGPLPEVRSAAPLLDARTGEEVQA